jgi:hypothetical protein
MPAIQTAKVFPESVGAFFEAPVAGSGFRDSAKMNSPKRGGSAPVLRKWFVTITAAAAINLIASLTPHKWQFIYGRIPYTICLVAITFPSETRPDKKPLSFGNK